MQNAFWDSIVFSVSVTLPNILMLFLGIFLRKRQQINENFCQQASKLVFNFTLPALLFVSIVSNNPNYQEQFMTLVAGIIGTIILFILSELVSFQLIVDKRERGVFVQGVFRGNAGIIGLSLCANAYGSAGLVAASIYTAVITLLYNVLAVITLSRSLSNDNPKNKAQMLQIFQNILKNPLIIAIVMALIIKNLNIHIPESLLNTGNYLSHMTLPLALLCAGASLNLKNVNRSSPVALYASIGRLIVAPLMLLIVARYFFHLEGMNLGILFLMSATPVSAASYVMVQAMGGKITTAANIIGLTTFGSMFSSGIGLVILRQLGWL